MSLDGRLTAIFEYAVTARGSVADIGCDHGKLAVALSKAGLRVIATDISNASLQKAERLAQTCGVDLQCRVGDGVSVLARNEVDTVIVAGLGGYEIADIIGSCDFRRYVLSPNNNARVVRERLLDADMHIEADKTVRCNGKYYDVIVASVGIPSVYDEKQLAFGRDILGNEAFIDRTKAAIATKRAALSAVESAEKTKNIMEELTALQEVLAIADNK